MLKLFFNRNSSIVKLLFFVSLALSAYYFIYHDWQQLGLFKIVPLFLFFLQIIFAFGVERYPWYPKNSPGPGITLQFQKGLVPIVYLWPLFMLNLFTLSSPVLLYLFNVLLLPINLANLILVVFHFKNDEAAPPNELSGQEH